MARSHSRREPLSRDRLLDAATAIADADGLEAVTIRGLARAVGVEPMSVYHYTASRDEITAALVDRVVEQIELPPSEGDWKAAVRACAVSAHRVLAQHPWACHPLMSAPSVAPGRLRQVDALLERLEDAHLEPDLADLAYHAIDSHILGFTLWEAGYTRGMPRLSGDELQAFVRSIHLDAYPHLAAHAAWHLEPRTRPRPDEFEFGLDLILDGVERLRDAAGSTEEAPSGFSRRTEGSITSL